MHVDMEDRRQPVKPQASWPRYLIGLALSVGTLTGFAYLYSTGWGVTVDVRKLTDAFSVNPTAADNPSLPQTDTIESAQADISEPAQSTQPVRKDSAYYVHPKGMPPIDYEVHVQKFNSVFIQHPACNPYDMKWSQMECSNYRARAMKRFSNEWGGKTHTGTDIK